MMTLDSTNEAMIQNQCHIKQCVDDREFNNSLFTSTLAQPVQPA